MTTQEELKAKYETSSSFNKEMQKANQSYMLLCQQAHYSSHAGFNHLVVSHFEQHPQPLVDKYFIYGAYQDEGPKAVERLTLYFITKVPKPKRPYVLVYFNKYQNSNGFSEFRNILSMMPIQYFLHLTKIVLVKPSLRNKASKLFSFSTIPKFINSMIVSVDSLLELSEELQTKGEDILKFLPFDVREMFLEEEKEMKEKEKLVGALKAIVSAGGGKEPKVMSMPSKRKKHIQEFSKNERGVPEMLQLLIFALKEHKTGLYEEGIFRKSANIEEQLELVDRMSAGDFNYLDSVQNPHVIANGIKKFFAKLESPLIPYEQFKRLMDPSHLTAEIVAEEVRKMENSALTNLLSLMVLIDFLKKDVIPKQNENKMTLQNIAICFAPCLLWAEQRSIKDIVYATKSVNVTSLMISEEQKIFGNHKDKKRIYRSTYLQQRKKSINQSYLVSLQVDEQVMTSTNSKIQKNKQSRLTPDFKELMLKTTQSYIEALDNISESSATEEHVSENFVIQETKPKESFPEKPKSSFDCKEKVEQIEGPASQKIEATSQNLLKPPVKKKGIFSSHIGSSLGEGASKSRSSNRSNKSINSIHSDV